MGATCWSALFPEGVEQCVGRIDAQEQPVAVTRRNVADPICGGPDLGS